MHTYRLIDMAGSEIGIVTDERERIGIVTDERERIETGDEVTRPDGASALVVDIYDDEFGTEGGVAATLALDDETS